MTKMKDTALDAMKRAARAVLKDELKELREQLREHTQAVRRLEGETEAANRAAHRAQASLRNSQSRVKKALTWADENRVGDFGFRACLEYVQGPPSLASLGCGGNHQFINPFDRWQVSPAIRD